MVTYLVDAHTTYQRTLNIESVIKEGYSAVVVKATQGATGFVAPALFDDWINRTRNQHAIPGAYHWINNENPVAQVARFLGRLSSVGGPEGLLIQLDTEDTINPPTRETVTAFIKEWFDKTGGHPLFVYSGLWWWPRYMGDLDLAAIAPAGKLALWHSHYVSGSGYGSVLYEQVANSWWGETYGGFYCPTILQYSSHGSTGGITANVDVSAYRGTPEKLREYTRGGSSPTPSPHPVPAPTPPPVATYVVHPGDTLSGIAAKYGLDWHTLAALNSLSNPNLIYPGQILRIQGGSSGRLYVVKVGDNLSKIAAKYGTSWQTLAAVNHLANPNLIFPGQRLALP